MKGRCACGAVTVTLDQRPELVVFCDCSLCQRVGAIWGYFAPAEVLVEGAISSFSRPDKDQPAVDIHFCSGCGCCTHWQLTPTFAHLERTGVNMRLFEWRELAGIEAQFADGSGWDGKSQVTYRRDPVTIGSDPIP